MARSSSGGIAIRYVASAFMVDVTLGRNGPYGDAWKAEALTYCTTTSGIAIPRQSLMSMNALFILCFVPKMFVMKSHSCQENEGWVEVRSCF